MTIMATHFALVLGAWRLRIRIDIDEPRESELDDRRAPPHGNGYEPAAAPAPAQRLASWGADDGAAARVSASDDGASDEGVGEGGGMIAPHADALIGHVRANRDRYLDELKAWIAVPSISAQPDHAARRAAFRRARGRAHGRRGARRHRGARNRRASGRVRRLARRLRAHRRC